MQALVVGGAGYIGSHMVRLLADRGCETVVLDDLSTGHADAAGAATLVTGDMADRGLLDGLFGAHRFDCVLHFGAFSQVGESMRDPGLYYANNVAGTLVLLRAMVDHGVRSLVFSSTAAIFGTPRAARIDEDHPQAPINPYGRTKWVVERMLEDFDQVHALRSVCLRYFNAAGAHPDASIGERHEPESHLIPLVLRVAQGLSPAIRVFGDDYPTPDGTCVRDYIHVCDLADAHWLAMQHLLGGGASARYNLGNGNGFSVREVIEAARRVTGHAIPVEIHPRRAGDPAALVAEPRRIREDWGWTPRHAALDEMVAHAWAFATRAG